MDVPHAHRPACHELELEHVERPDGVLATAYELCAHRVRVRSLCGRVLDNENGTGGPTVESALIVKALFLYVVRHVEVVVYTEPEEFRDHGMHLVARRSCKCFNAGVRPRLAHADAERVQGVESLRRDAAALEVNGEPLLQFALSLRARETRYGDGDQDAL